MKVIFQIRLKELREAAGYSQYSFADAFGVAQSTVGGWEAGKREPNFDTAQRLADFFNVSTDYLLGRTNDPTPPSASPEIDINSIEFALYGEVRELDEEDKLELLRDAKRMRELLELRKKQREKETT